MNKTLEKVVANCSYLLNNYFEAKQVKEYLDKRLSKDIQEKYGFGYFPDLRHLDLVTSSLSEEDLSKAGLLYYREGSTYGGPEKEKHSQLENHNLIIPYRDLYGNIIGIVGRTVLLEEERQLLGLAKYKNTPFKKSRHLFGLFEAKRAILEKDAVFVVEGQFDCISCHTHGLENTVALGCSGMSFEQLCLLCRYTNNIYLLLDNDDGGKSGREQIVKSLGKWTNIKNIYLPEKYKDIDQFWKENSIEDWTKIVGE